MKDILKTIELFEEHIDRLAKQGIYEIERDLILERLRQLYATVTSLEVVPANDIDEPVMYGCPFAPFSPSEEVEEKPEVAEEEPIAEEVPSEEPQIEEEPIEEPVVEEALEEMVEEVPEEEPEPIEEVAVPTEEPEVVAEQPAEVSEELDHEVVMSLYDDDDDDDEAPQEEVVEKVEEPEPIAEEPIAEEPEEIEEVVEEEMASIAEEQEPIEEDVVEPQSAPQSVVLGDILASEQPTLADNLAEQVLDVATATSSNLSLRQTIAINDKFILMRDLFANNNDYYEMAIDRLDSFDNLDDAMLYIYDNFHWNPNCEGARLLMELLARKLI